MAEASAEARFGPKNSEASGVEVWPFASAYRHASATGASSRPQIKAPDASMKPDLMIAKASSGGAAIPGSLTKRPIASVKPVIETSSLFVPALHSDQVSLIDGVLQHPHRRYVDHCAVDADRAEARRLRFGVFARQPTRQINCRALRREDVQSNVDLQRMDRPF